MKTLFLALALVSIAALSSCQKDDTPPNNILKNKLQGKWKLERIETDLYRPSTVFDYHDQYLGTTSDSVVFKSNGELFNYIDEPDPTDPDISDWEIVNDTTLLIDGQVSKIRELTATRLMLHSDDTYPSQNKREVVDVYFYR
jgi:hypothetical protein